MTNCINCGKVNKGRPDKKFCDDNCRSNYHNKKRKKGRKVKMEKHYMDKLIDDMGNCPL
jgi:predicted nucleic acid-binding Zn ribbon protein